MHIPFVYVNCGIAQNLSFSNDLNAWNGDMKNIKIFEKYCREV